MSSNNDILEIKNGVFQINNFNKRKIFVIGDIHGDYQVFVHCMVDLCSSCSISRIYDSGDGCKNREELIWDKNNKNIIIFCGDLIHRKRFLDHVLDDECSDIFILKTLFRLKQEARENGGDIIIILGNHEIMNILVPDIKKQVYTSPKNLDENTSFFNNTNEIKKLINQSYAWIKFNNILISHGGLCSKYYKINLKKHNLKGDELISFVNDEFHDYFSNGKYKLSLNQKSNSSGFKLFEEYDDNEYSSDTDVELGCINNNKNHNMFWCRQWGYTGISCKNFHKTINYFDCNKMIIAHCPQFLEQNSPKMINFECKDPNDKNYSLARIDLGMSRCFDYNKKDKFFYYLNYNYNRKISILQLFHNNKNNYLYFDNNSIVTKKLSCIQYLLLKYGIHKEDWIKKGIDSNWLGFDYINDKLFNNSYKCDKIPNYSHNKLSNYNESILYCLLYPIINKNFSNLKSIKPF